MGDASRSGVSALHVAKTNLPPIIMNPIELPAAGLHYGVPYEVYAKWPAINFSKLKPIRDTASKCKWEMDHPKEPTPSMILGSAMHIAVLEPARFEQVYYLCPPCDRRTSEGKEIYAKAERGAQGKVLIRQGAKDDEGLLNQVAALKGMVASIKALRTTAPFLQGVGHNEVSAVWRDEETGLWCKGRFDRLIPDFGPWEGVPVIVEIKTAQDASEWGFGKSADSFGYAAQAAGYRQGLKAITGKSPAHVLIVAESSPPYDAAVFMLDGPSLQTGLLQYRQMLTRYAECVAKNQWPGYPDKLQVLSLPKYAHERNYEK